jgi:alkanesulfonate monooxygenase SsuD/methylene tetrahydromethanopterin reductase-like flavin-dependent oxidoreductase (luciferase family)
MFEPKPVQKPWPPIHVGGESDAALRRAATCQGWIGLAHTPESVAPRLSRLAELRDRAGRANERFEATIHATPTVASEVRQFEAAGVDRLNVAPWRRSSEALDGLRRFAERFIADSG